MDDFDDRLKAATKAIASEYFQLPVVGKELPIYRERCYCYELYHQLRKDWPECAYRLCGEIDKAGHRVIRDNDLDRTKPDLLVHVPEDMSCNYAVIEVKPITGTRRGVRKDVNTLLAYLNCAEYARAIYVIYGSENDGNALQFAIELIEQAEDKRIELWHHAAAYAAANRYSAKIPGV